MYDDYPAFDVPQRNIVQRFFAQRWSAILSEIVLTLVITVAAGQAFDFFDPFNGADAEARSNETADMSEAAAVALAPVTERGMAHARDREFAAAEALFDLAIAVAPGQADFHHWRGYINLHARDYEAARADFRQALDLADGDDAAYDAHVSLCWAYGESADFVAAMSHCRAALETASSPTQVAIALENRCWLRVEMGEYAAAASDCWQALEIYPGDCQLEVCALAHFNLGRVLLAQGLPAQALARYNQAYQIGSAYPDMYLEIARLYATLGYEAAASSSYRAYQSLIVGGA